MAMQVVRSGRDEAADLVAALSSWAPEASYQTTMHAGDVGWHLRLDDTDLGGGLVAVVDGSEIVAVAILEGGSLRPTVKPGRSQDREIAEALASIVDELPAEVGADTDAASSVFRALLVSRGWQVDPDAWVLLYRRLSGADGEFDDRFSAPLRSDTDVADRVWVQTRAFARSSFTTARWRQMAAGPGFDPAFEYLRRDLDGAPVAAATGWSAGPGKVAILEPVGTDREHTGHGHGRAVSSAVIAALARAGASGVSVSTPASNPAAVRTYESCGLRSVELLHALHRPAGGAAASGRPGATPGIGRTGEGAET